MSHEPSLSNILCGVHTAFKVQQEGLFEAFRPQKRVQCFSFARSCVAVVQKRLKCPDLVVWFFEKILQIWTEFEGFMYDVR